MAAARRLPLALAGLLFACADTSVPDSPRGDDIVVDSAPAPDTSPAARPFVPADSVVFIFEVSEYEHVYFEPLYVVMPDGELRSMDLVQGTPEADRFEAAYYAPGSRYHATSRGRPVGVIEIDGPALAGCVGLPGEAAFLEKVPAASMTGLAFPREHAARDFVVAPTAAEDSAARAAVLDHLRAREVPESKLGEAVWGPVVVVATPDGARTVLASAEVSAFHEADMPTGGFAMLEQTATGLIDPRAPEDEAAIESGRVGFFDAADLDDDGYPELVLRQLHYESWDFSVYRRAGAAWELIFHGAGSGC